MMESERFEMVGEAGDGEEVIRKIPYCKPHVVLMDINMPIMNGLEATEKISDLYPDVIVIIMSVQAENEYLKKAMFSGAKEYIIKPINYDTLVQTIEATYIKNKERISSLSHKNQPEKNSKVITFYSSKGGVGKSVLSVNTALTLSRAYKKKTLLIDMDLQYGDVALMLNLYGEKTILEMVDDHQWEHYDTASTYLVKLNEKMDVLLAPTNPEASEYISKDMVQTLIKGFMSKYDFIIVDTAVNFDETTLHVLDVSDQVLMVTTMELSSVKNTKLGINVMKTLSYEDKKVKVVVNEARGKFGINVKELKEIFNNNILAFLPEDIKEIRLSINKGTPVCMNGNKGPFGKCIYEMCKKFLLEEYI